MTGRWGHFVGPLSLVVAVVVAICRPGTTGTVVVLTAIFGALGLAWLCSKGSAVFRWLGRRYDQLEECGKARVRHAQGEPIKVYDDGRVERWRLRDGRVVTYVPELVSYKALAAAGRIDPRSTRIGHLRQEPVPDGWIGRWKARREARRQST